MNVCMCICMCVCLRVSVYIRTLCTYICTGVPVCMCTYVCTDRCACTHVRVCIYQHIHITCVHNIMLTYGVDYASLSVHVMCLCMFSACCVHVNTCMCLCYVLPRMRISPSSSLMVMVMVSGSDTMIPISLNGRRMMQMKDSVGSEMESSTMLNVISDDVVLGLSRSVNEARRVPTLTSGMIPVSF